MSPFFTLVLVFIIGLIIQQIIKLAHGLYFIGHQDFRITRRHRVSTTPYSDYYRFRSLDQRLGFLETERARRLYREAHPQLGDGPPDRSTSGTPARTETTETTAESGARRTSPTSRRVSFRSTRRGQSSSSNSGSSPKPGQPLQPAGATSTASELTGGGPPRPPTPDPFPHPPNPEPPGVPNGPVDQQPRQSRDARHRPARLKSESPILVKTMYGFLQERQRQRQQLIEQQLTEESDSNDDNIPELGDSTTPSAAASDAAPEDPGGPLASSPDFEIIQ